MHAPSRLLTRLNMETRAQHPEADYPWLELMSLDASRTRYVAQLTTTYGFEAPVEAAVALAPRMSDVISLRERSRSGFIVEDLLSLGLTPATIARLPQCKHVVPFREPTEALGWLYVLERATLLHDTVRTHLTARLPMISAWTYLSAYRGAATLRWQELGRALDAFAESPGAAEVVVAAARAAFACLRDWYASGPARDDRDDHASERAHRDAR